MSRKAYLHRYRNQPRRPARWAVRQPAGRLALLLWATCVGCSGGPKLTTELRPPPPGIELTPPPPSGAMWMRIASGKVPEQTRDGTAWDEDGLPDPYAVIKLQGKELLRTDQAADTLSPEWPKSPAANFEFDSGASLTISLFDADGLNDKLIGHKSFPAPSPADVSIGKLDLNITEKARVSLVLEPAHAMFGLGFDYEVRRQICHVTTVFKHGPAGRAGMRVGDQIFSVDGRKIAEMNRHELKSAFNSIGVKGLKLVVLHGKDSTEEVVIREGPVYPLFEEHGPID